MGDLVAGEAEEISKSYFLGSGKFLAEFSKYILIFKRVNKKKFVISCLHVHVSDESL